MVISVTTLNTIHIFSILCFSFAIFSYSLFFKKVKIVANLMGTTFIIPFIVTFVSYLIFTDISFFKMLAISEIIMFLFLILISIKEPSPKQMDLIMFSSVLTPILLCTYFNFNRHLQIFYVKDMYYAIIASSVSILFIILHRSDSDPNNLSKPVFYLTLSYVLSAFDGLPILQMISIILKLIFYFSTMRLVYIHVHDEIMKEVTEAKKIQKNFKDEIQKEVTKRLFYMEMSKDKISKISQTDELTKALNRRGIMRTIEDHILSKSTSIFSLLIFDIDKFKNVNDTLGHIVGDKCLKTLATIAMSNIRDHDALGRYGGDEFLIVLPGLDSDDAYHVAERFRSKVAQTDDPHFTISIGISTYPIDGKNVKTLIDEADSCLYTSKERGRNTVTKKDR